MIYLIDDSACPPPSFLALRLALCHERVLVSRVHCECLPCIAHLVHAHHRGLDWRVMPRGKKARLDTLILAMLVGQQGYHILSLAVPSTPNTIDLLRSKLERSSGDAEHAQGCRLSAVRPSTKIVNEACRELHVARSRASGEAATIGCRCLSLHFPV